jgi:hypothetical protein
VGNDDDENEDDDEERWRRDTRSDRAPRDERTRKFTREREQEEDDDDDEESNNSDEWDDQDGQIWLEGIEDLVSMEGFSEKQPHEWESKEKGLERAGGDSGWGDAAYAGRGENSEIVRLSEVEEERMRKSFVWAMTQAVVQSPVMRNVRAEWRRKYGEEGEFSIHWLWEDSSPQWYDEEERKRTILTTIAAMMDPTEAESYIRIRMNPWESYLNEVQERLLRTAVDETGEVLVRGLIQYLHAMEGRGERLSDMGGRSKRMCAIIHESLEEIRQVIKEERVSPRAWGKIMTERIWAAKVKKETQTEWESQEKGMAVTVLVVVMDEESSTGDVISLYFVMQWGRQM